MNFGAAKLTVEGQFPVEAVIDEAIKENVRATPEDQAPSNLSGETAASDPFTIAGASQETLMMVGTGALLLTGWLTGWLITGKPLISIVIYALTIVAGGYPTARKGIRSLFQLNFDINVLMTVAVVGAGLIGEWGEGAVVAFLFNVSEALESYSMDKVRSAIRALMEIAPKTARIRKGAEESEVRVESIRVGDLMVIRPGEKIAMDGRVVTGASAVNQAAITGESVPAEKHPGSEVFAGTINDEGLLEVEVTKLVADTTLAKIIHLVEEAQAQRAPAQQFVDIFARYYTPAVMVLSAAIILVPTLVLGQPWGKWIYQGLALLVVACPCALVVSTPVALVSAIANAARNGVLIKGGLFLEQAGRLAALAFDKTGTLTRGRPVLTDVVKLGNDSPWRLLCLAGGIERFSEHSLGKAIVEAARRECQELAPAEQFSAITGKGASAVVEGSRYYIGSPRLFSELGLTSDQAREVVTRFQAEGKTAMILGSEREILGVLAVADELRETSVLALRELERAGVGQVVMLTGDNARTAQAIAQKAGITEFRAELLPQDKVNAIKELRDRFGTVGMVGDGVNDAPALAAATVGIAMGGAGTDVALETADIALMADDLSKLPFLVRLSRSTLMVIKQNIGLALILKLAAVVAVFPGWLTLWLAILADMGATILVTLNGIRLMRIRPER